jgi:hypothetical protein
MWGERNYWKALCDQPYCQIWTEKTLLQNGGNLQGKKYQQLPNNAIYLTPFKLFIHRLLLWKAYPTVLFVEINTFRIRTFSFSQLSALFLDFMELFFISAFTLCPFSFDLFLNCDLASFQSQILINDVPYLSKKISTFFFFGGGTGVWTQGSTFARQALYYLSHVSKPFCFKLFFR